MQPLSGNQRPDLLTSLMNMSLVLRLPRKMHLCRSSSNVPRLPTFLDMLQNPHVSLTLTRCTIPRACRTKRHLNLQNWSKHVLFFNILSWKCALRYNGMHFFDIWTSKNAPRLRCFVHFWLRRRNGLCFFQHLNFQKCTEAEVFVTFWLGKVLRATTACTFFNISTSKSAPNPSEVCFIHIVGSLTSKLPSNIYIHK